MYTVSKHVRKSFRRPFVVFEEINIAFWKLVTLSTTWRNRLLFRYIRYMERSLLKMV